MTNLPLIIVGVLLNAGAQVCMRFGMLRIGGIKSIGGLLESMPKMLGNFWLWLAILCYAFSLLIWMVILSRVEVGYAYCFIALGFVLVTIAGFFLFGENITLNRITGIVLICAGIIFVAKS